MYEPSAALIWGVVLGMGAINFALRFTPIAMLSRARIPRPVMRWLSFIPISVMGSLVALEVLRPGGTWLPPLSSPYVWAAALTAVVFAVSRSFLGATLAGIGSFIALQWALGTWVAGG